MFNPSMIKDACGRGINFLESLDWSVAKSRLSKDEMKLLQEAFQEDIQGIPSKLGLTSKLGRPEIVYILGCMIPFVIARVGSGYLPQTGSYWVSFVLEAVVYALCMSISALLIVKWRCRTLSHERPFPRTALGFGYCPACLYDLQQLDSDAPDGCTVCPECGGAWKLPR